MMNDLSQSRVCTVANYAINDYINQHFPHIKPQGLINNMLGVILGYTELVLEQTKEDQPVYSALQHIQQAAQRSADLTQPI